MKVADLLSARERALAPIHHNISVREAAERMREAQSGAIVLSDNEGSLDGVLTERDVAYGVAAHGPKALDLPASALATTAGVSCSPTDHVTQVARVMAERHLHHIPVRERGRLLDVISITDILEERLHDRRRVTRALVSAGSIRH